MQCVQFKKIGRINYTVRKITSYYLYLCRLQRIPCIDTEYNLQILIWIYTDSFLYQQILSSIDTAYMICQLLLTVSTVKMFSSMNGCQMYLQMYLLCCLLATFIAWLIYSYVNILFMTTKSLGTCKLLLTVSTGKTFCFMNWCQMYL